MNTRSFTSQYSGEHRWSQGYNGPTSRYQIHESAHQGDRPTYFVRMYFNFDNSFRPADGKTGVGIKGFGIASDPFTYLDFGGWHCYEVGLYLNTPGKFNGEARFWIDGVLQSRVTGMRYRDIASLLPTEMHLNMHRVTDDFPQTMIRWTDNIVLATRYIGPVKKTSRL